MRHHDQDDHDLRALIERGSSTWDGPSPLARQARWAEEERPRRWMSAGLAAAGCGLAVLVIGSLALFATSQTPDGAAESVVRLVSHVFTTPTATPPVTPPSAPASGPAAPAGAPTPSAHPPAASRPGRTPTPEPEIRRPPSSSPWPQPSPSGSGQPPNPAPSPSPTDE